MNEVYNADGTPHATNARATIDDDDNDFWFGFEQEYFLWDPETNLPLGFPRDQTPPRSILLLCRCKKCVRSRHNRRTS